MQYRPLLSLAAASLAAASLAGAQPESASGRIVYNRVSGNTIALSLTDGGLQSERLLTFRGVDPVIQPDISRDGRRVAFAAPGRESELNLYVAGTDGSGLKGLVGDAALPAWSPDGTKLLYSTASIPPTVGTVNADGSAAKQLPIRQRVATAPFWSPDGKRIAYTAADEPNPRTADVFLAGADGSDPVRLTDRRKMYIGGAGAWSPDGKSILLSAVDLALRKTELQLWDVEGRKGRRVTDVGSGLPASDAPLEAKRIIKSACWSPDGKLILATLGRGRPGRADVGLFTLSPEGVVQRRVSPEGVLCFHGSWSPQ